MRPSCGSRRSAMFSSAKKLIIEPEVTQVNIHHFGSRFDDLEVDKTEGSRRVARRRCKGTLLGTHQGYLGYIERSPLGDSVVIACRAEPGDPTMTQPPQS